MRHRIYVDTIQPSVLVTGEEFHHSVRVVRLRVGEEVELFDKAGNAARGVLAALERDQAVIMAGDPLPSRESPLALHLAMSIINLEKFELVLQKATELGVRSITPLVTDRIELRAERYAGKAERWKKILFEAVKQCGRTRVPELEEPAKFANVIARPGTKIFFDADAESSRLTSLDEATLFIGPEGGWSEGELAAAREHGAHFERLGPRRLRAETAAIVAVSVIASRFGDL
ncbi:MAG: 16S rRNA (uracil(1498)-N(3))-methyltransferase [Acidobacteriota bacterium]|nr:16S rRNA (uracil(1498)-N(3))-methyltransferase [Acidobacteriota bacterium]